jgi:hypothetical protein
VEYQIILLPRTDYWIWLRACREYVKAFGAGLTDDPGVAGRYMAPRQVITLPSRRDGFPEIGEAAHWFQSRYPGIRLDVVDADTPDALHKRLRRRVADNDRYGAKRKPFYLLWPTDYPTITQSFGANPQIYRRYGFPGHEGVDLRALTNTNVYACADGEAYDVHTNPRDHAYGIHVRLQHRDGYKTIYAHLARALVALGDRVQAGQLIGRADSTGNSSAAHLHLSLKRDGATARKETTYPKDILDPTPYLVWPAQSASHAKGLSAPAWSAGRCLVGVHVPRGAVLGTADLEALRMGRPEAVLLGDDVTRGTVDALREVHAGLLMVARLEMDGQPSAGGTGAFMQSARETAGRLLALGIQDFELHSEPNLTERGLGRLWKDAAEFNRWFVEAAAALKGALPGIRLGFPMLAPGDSVSGRRQAMDEFLNACDEAVALADWLGVACFWTSPDGLDLPTEGRAYETYRSLFPDKLLFVTGLGPCDPSQPEVESARQALLFLEGIRDVPAVAAAFAGVTAEGRDREPLVWRGSSGGPSELAQALGRRQF